MAKIAPYVFVQEFDNNGEPLAGGLLYTYEAGTTTNKATFTDPSEDTANANPVVLDASGRADIWLGSGAYKLVLRDSAGVLIKEVDNIVGEASNVFGASVTTVTTNLSVTEAYQNGILKCTSAVTLSLLDVATAEEGFLFTVKNESNGNVTIDPDAAELVDGSATLTIYPQQSSIIVCDGTGWVSVLLSQARKNNYTATVAPAVSNDDSEGYTVGSFWYDVTADESYICLDATTGAAVWLNTTLTIDDLGSSATKDFIDDDTFATATADNIPSAESVKTYVDTEVAASGFTLGTPATLTSGTTHDFTSIPSGVKQIVINFDVLQLSSTDDFLIQLGDSGGVESSGYISTSTYLSAGSNVISATNGFVVNTFGFTSPALSGSIVLSLLNETDNTWSCAVSCAFSGSATASVIGGGSKTLSAELDRLRITSLGGVNTFLAGEVNISYIGGA